MLFLYVHMTSSSEIYVWISIRWLISIFDEIWEEQGNRVFIKKINCYHFSCFILAWYFVSVFIVSEFCFDANVFLLSQLNSPCWWYHLYILKIDIDCMPKIRRFTTSTERWILPCFLCYSVFFISFLVTQHSFLFIIPSKVCVRNIVNQIFK